MGYSCVVRLEFVSNRHQRSHSGQGIKTTLGFVCFSDPSFEGFQYSREPFSSADYQSSQFSSIKHAFELCLGDLIHIDTEKDSNGCVRPMVSSTPSQNKRTIARRQKSEGRENSM